MKLIKESYLLMLIVFGLLSLSLYSTYALFTASTTINNVVSFEATLTTNSNIIEYEMVEVAAGETKIIEVTVSNSYGSSLYYGAWYEILSGSSSDIELGLYTEEDNTPSSGTLASGASLTLLVGISNNGSSKALVNIGTIGSLTSNLGLVSPRTLLPSGWEPVIDNNFANTIIKLRKGSTWSSGSSGVYKTNDHEYRYIGANVNNYVSFNNDIYRIIGVFDSNSHGVTGQNLVKLIPANVMTANSWGVYNSSNTSGTYSSYKNDWTGATTGVKANLNVLLNEYFYNKTSTSSTYGACSNWTYYYINTNYRTNDCTLITGYGINNIWQNYIENTTWYLYGYSVNGLSKQNFYLCERGQYDGCTSANSGAYSTSTQAKIGLMYVSDYMYASGYYSSSDTTTGSSRYYGNQNWLYQGYEWTITPRSDTSGYAFNVNSSGYVHYIHSFNAYAVRPTFYLKSSVYITGGDGTFSNPYTISM